MSDPRLVPPEKRIDQHLSDLMKAKKAATKGEVVNFCPYGCDVSGLDENGYCKHLVGFTVDKKTFEPMKRAQRGKRGVGRAVRVPSRVVRFETEMEEQPIMVKGADGKEEPKKDEDGLVQYHSVPVKIPIYEFTPEAVKKDDILVQITSSYRVYRDIEGTGVKRMSPAQESLEVRQLREEVEALKKMVKLPEAKEPKPQKQPA